MERAINKSPLAPSLVSVTTYIYNSLYPKVQPAKIDSTGGASTVEMPCITVPLPGALFISENLPVTFNGATCNTVTEFKKQIKLYVDEMKGKI